MGTTTLGSVVPICSNTGANSGTILLNASVTDGDKTALIAALSSAVKVLNLSANTTSVSEPFGNWSLNYDPGTSGLVVFVSCFTGVFLTSFFGNCGLILMSAGFGMFGLWFTIPVVVTVPFISLIAIMPIPLYVF